MDKLRTEFQFLSIPLFKAKNTDVEFRIGNSFFLNWLLQKHTNKGKKGCLNVNKQAIKGSQFVNKDGLRAYIQVSGRYTFFPFFLFLQEGCRKKILGRCDWNFFVQKAVRERFERHVLNMRRQCVNFLLKNSISFQFSKQFGHQVKYIFLYDFFLNFVFEGARPDT